MQNVTTHQSNNAKKPFISIKALNLPQNRINQNGLLDHPQDLIQAYKAKHEALSHHKSGASLLQTFKEMEPFKVSNSTLPASLLEKIISKQAAIWASNQLKFYKENPEQFKNFERGIYNSEYYKKNGVEINNLQNLNSNMSSNILSQISPETQNMNTSFFNRGFSSSQRFPSDHKEGFFPSKTSPLEFGSQRYTPLFSKNSQGFCSKSENKGKKDLRERLLINGSGCIPFRHPEIAKKEGEKESENLVISLRKRPKSSSQVEIDFKGESDGEASFISRRRKQLKIGSNLEENKERSRSASRFDKLSYFERFKAQNTKVYSSNSGFSFIQRSPPMGLPEGLKYQKEGFQFLKDPDFSFNDVSKIKNLSIPRINNSTSNFKKLNFNSEKLKFYNEDTNENLKLSK